MPSVPWGNRIAREVALAAFGVSADGFDSWVLDRFTDLLEEQYVRAGDVLWSAGEPLESLYFMHRGRVRAIRDHAPPWVFDGRWLLGAFEGHGNRPPSRSLIADTDFDVLRIGRRAWLDMLEDSFELTHQGVVRASSAVALLDEKVLVLDGPSPCVTTEPTTEAPLTVVERLAFLTEIGMARGAGVQALADLAGVSEARMLREGEELFQAGWAPDHLHLVVAGEIEATREGLDVRRQYGSRELVPGAAALSNEVRHWRARARVAAQVLAVPLEAWFDLMEEHFDLADSTLAMLAAARERLLDRLAEEAGASGVVLR